MHSWPRIMQLCNPLWGAHPASCWNCYYIGVHICVTSHYIVCTMKFRFQVPNFDKEACDSDGSRCHSPSPWRDQEAIHCSREYVTSKVPQPTLHAELSILLRRILVSTSILYMEIVYSEDKLIVKNHTSPSFHTLICTGIVFISWLVLISFLCRYWFLFSQTHAAGGQYGCQCYTVQSWYQSSRMPKGYL